MSIQIRENTDFVITCKNVLGVDRWFNYSFYHAPEYEKFQDNAFRLMRAKKFSMTLIAHDRDYKQYNTEEIVDRLDIVPEDETKKVRSMSKK